MKTYISYLRVSSKGQEISGLGLESQRQIVLNYITHQKAELHSEYVEIESGGVNNRVELKKALDVCQNVGGVLVIAKLDRLSRNVSFISSLMESKVNFICCDMPDASPLTIHIFSALAEWERNRISERTREALLTKKRREPHWKPGNPKNLTKEARNKSYQTIMSRARTDQSVRHAYHFIKPLKEEGMSFQHIADLLNSEGYRTRTGKSFHPQQVWNILKRFEDKT